jgi:hypothetical protein
MQHNLITLPIFDRLYIGLSCVSVVLAIFMYSTSISGNSLPQIIFFGVKELVGMAE